MFVTTTELESGRGALAHLISDDGDHWVETDSIYTCPDSGQPECPDYFCFRGKYYLVFSPPGHTVYMVSDGPFGPWSFPDNPEIPCGRVPKAAVWNDRLFFTGFRPINGYAGTLTFMEADADEQGILRFKKI